MNSWITGKLRDVAAGSPGQLAVLNGSRRTSYAQFMHMCNSLAHQFANSEEPPRVLICADRSSEVYAAMFAAMMAGGFYTPLNPDAGLSRMRTAFEEIRPNVALLNKRTLPVIQSLGYDGKIVLVESLAFDDAPPFPSITPHQLAYVMFTSGSTGRPKGVMIPQDALAHYSRWALSTINPTAADRWSQHPNIGFDLSVLDIYGCLLGGATLVPLDDPMDKLLPARAIKRNQLTIWNSVPSVMGMMQKSGDWTKENVSSLRLITFCGEPLLAEHVKGIFEVLPQAYVQNTYGPTEATVSCSHIALTAENFLKHARGGMCFGTPIPGTEFILADGQSDGAADIGELLIVSNQLAKGYWNDPEKSARSFREIEHKDRKVMAYHTGDIVQRAQDGYYFVERADNQVKIKGFRIELNEISNQIRKQGFVHVITFVHNQQIISAIEGPGGPTLADRILKDLKHELEYYMLPADIVFMDKLPRNENDKLDLAAVRERYSKGRE